MFWFALIIGFGATTLMVFFHHFHQLLKVIRDYRGFRQTDNLDSAVQASLKFNDYFYKFSTDIHGFLKSLEDEFSSGAFNIFFRHKDMGPLVLEEVDQLYRYHHELHVRKLNGLKRFSQRLPILGWLVVLTGMSLYFRNYTTGESTTLLESTLFFGLGAVSAGYGIILNLWLLQPYAERIQKSQDELRSKYEVIVLTIKNAMHGKTSLELEGTLRNFSLGSWTNQNRAA